MIIKAFKITISFIVVMFFELFGTILPAKFVTKAENKFVDWLGKNEHRA